MKSTSSKDFLLWQAHFERKLNDFNPQFYYFAALRQDLDRIRYYLQVQVTKKEEVKKIREPYEKLNQYLLNFQKPKEEKKEPPELKQSTVMSQKAKDSKRAWLAAVGLRPDGTPNPSIIRRTKKPPEKKKSDVNSKT